jgi:hypothetical protein
MSIPLGKLPDDFDPQAWQRQWKLKHPNADNEGLGGFPGLAIPDEVGGAGADEMPYMPTRSELLVLVKHWIVVYWDYRFAEEFLLEQYGSSGWREASFAERRINRIAELLGDDAVSAAIDEAAASYAANFTGLGLKGWHAFWEGTEQEQEDFHAESRAEEEKRQEERDSKPCAACGHRNDSHCRRGRVGCLQREPNHGEQFSEEHCSEPDCMCSGFARERAA